MVKEPEQPRTKHNLPVQPTAFVGRQAEINEIIDLLSQPDCQLLTLVGPGGIGKTRLAIEVAEQLLESFDDGVYFIPLAPLRSTDHIVNAIARSVNVQLQGKSDPAEQLLAVLQARKFLLLLDNFDHLLESATWVIDVLNSVPGIKILATSREALNLRAEWVYHVEGMLCPDPDDLEGMPSSEAVQLFTERARQVRQGALEEEDQACVARICKLVAGMPLAIELAAAWTRTLSCNDIADEIKRNKDFLATNQPDVPERHRSIRAVFHQSWGMLTEAEQLAYRRLSIFRGGFTQQAAQAVTHASLLTLTALVDKSLLRQVKTGRYGIHQLLRQYARQELEESGEIEATRTLHSNYFLDLLASYEPDLKGGNQVEALNAIALDFNNMRAAWYWAVDQKDYAAVDQALESLSNFCGIRVYYQDGLALFRYARERLAPDKGEEPSLTWAKTLLYWIGPKLDKSQAEQAVKIAKKHKATIEIAEGYTNFAVIAFEEGDYAASVEWREKALAQFEEAGEQFRIVRALLGLGTAHVQLGNPERHIELVRRALALARQTGDQEGIADALTEVALYSLFQGQYAEAERTNAEAITISGEIGHRSIIAWANITRGFCHLLLGDSATAQTMVEQGQHIANVLGFPIPKGWGKTVAAWIACANGDYLQASDLAEEALALFPEFRAEIRPLASLALAYAAAGLEDWESAKRNSILALEQLTTVHAVGPLMLGLTMAAQVASHEATEVNDWIRASEWLGLAFTHPASPVDFLDNLSVLATLRSELCTHLDEDIFDAAWERGENQEWEPVLANAVKQLQLHHDDSELVAAQAANESLIDPLTERELEILQYIADGHSNREIADLLYVGVSTIKSHINHIYRKLDVESRTQALVRGKELDLIV